MSIKWILIFVTAFLANNLPGQDLELLNSGSKEHFRGLSVVSDEVIWVSGTSGTVGKSLDGGHTWKFIQVPGFEQKDFRDIEAFDENTAIVIAIDSPAYILRTTNGGANWHVVFEAHYSDVFLDAVDFYNRKKGVVIGDPVDGRAFIATTKNGGKKWKYLPAHQRPILQKGEAFFAASGTNIKMINKRDYAFVSGGTMANLYWDNRKIPLPVLKGKSTTGPNSLDVFIPKENFRRSADKGKGILVVGGDFSARNDRAGNIALSQNSGEDWEKISQPPYGYRSCAIFLDANTIITCGISGIDISENGGKNFRPISNQGFHVVQQSGNRVVFFAGANGTIGRMLFTN